MLIGKLSYSMIACFMCFFVVSCSIGGHYGLADSPKGIGAVTGVVASNQSTMPWPPPMPSSYFTIDLKSLIKRNHFSTLANINDYIVSKLHEANYNQLGYYPAPGGFAIVMPSEAIYQNGQPLRKMSRNEQDEFGSIPHMLKKLITKSAGHYRILVFIITTDLSGSDSGVLTIENAKQWVNKANRGLSDNIKKLPVESSHIAYFNIYEFEKKQGEDAIFLNPSPNNSYDELALSGIKLD
jgi:hypothetical protein